MQEPHYQDLEDLLGVASWQKKREKEKMEKWVNMLFPISRNKTHEN